MASSETGYVLLLAWSRAIFCIYAVASIPWRLAFRPEFTLSISKFPGFVILDLATTMFFSYDVISMAREKFSSSRLVLPETVNLMKAQINESSGLHFDDSEMFEHFQPNNSWWNILIHLLASLPLEYASLFLVEGQEWPNYLLINRLLRLGYIHRYLNDLSALLAKRGYIKNVGFYRTWLLFFTMALAGHLCGSVFYWIGRRDAMNGFELTWPEVAGIYTIDSKYDGLQLRMKQTAVHAYISSLYWAYITMITTGFGDIVPLHIHETLWCIFSMFIGVMITTLTIANLQLLVTNLDASRLEFQRKIEMVKKFMHYRKLPTYLQDRILAYYDYQWTVLKGADEQKFLAELPRTMQQQVTNFMCRDIIASLPILRNANNALLNALVECSEMNIYSPNDKVVKHGEKLRGAILVAHGEVEVLKGKVVERKMRQLDRYAEECLFEDKNATHTVRSKGFSEIILIPRVHFQKIITAQCEETYVNEMRQKTMALSKSNSKANKMFGSADEVTPSSGFQKHCQPHSFFRKIWSCLVLFGYIFYMFSIPLSLMSITKDEPFSATPVLLSLGYVVDFFFIFDSIFEFQYFMYKEEGIIVFDKEQIRIRYLCTRSLPREIIGLLPLDWISILLRGRCVHYFRLVKLVRVPNMFLYTDSISEMLSELDVDLSLIRVIKLNILMILVSHWVGCCWYMMSDLSVQFGLDKNWVVADENNEVFTVKHSDYNGFSAYLRSIYWAIVGMSTVGYGDIVATNIIETTYSTVIILFGGLFLPAVVGGLAAYIANFRYASIQYRKNLRKARRYLKDQIKMNDDHIELISRFYNYAWLNQGGVMDENVMDELSTPLRISVSSFINKGPILAIPFFSRCNDTILQLILSSLQHQQFIPSDIIIEEGGISNELYLLFKGHAIATLASLPQLSYRFLRNGDYFGESGLISSTNFETVKASNYCECYSLSRADFEEALEGSSVAKKVKADIANYHMKSTLMGKRILQNISQHSKCTRLVLEMKSFLKKSMARRDPTNVLLPNSPFYILWNCFLFMACVYNAWMIPFRLAFSETAEISIAIDWIIDLLFLIDAYANYCLVGFVKDGEVITNVEKIKQNYIKRRLKMDILSTCPFDLIAFLLLPRALSFTNGLSIGDMLRILKLLRFPRYFSVIEKVFFVLQDKNVPLAPLRLVEFFGGVILIAHFAACGFFAFARWNSDNGYCSQSSFAGCQWYGTWIYRQIWNGKLPIDGGEVWQQYIRSFNWALPTLVVVVIGDVVPTTSAETLYVFLWMVIGVTINASIIGNVANIVANLESDQHYFARKVDEIKTYMFKHHLSYDLHARVDDFTRYLWSAHRGSIAEDEFILHLPHSLLAKTLHQRVKHIQNCPFFDFCSSNIIDALAVCMRPLIFSVGDTIAYAGDMGQEMFFLERGVVQVVSSDTQQTVFATLVEGSYFGETSLIFKQPRATAVKAVTFCDVLELLKKDLFSELKRRDFDLIDMMNTFASVHEENKRRNKAIQENLIASKRKKSKLSKIIDSDVSTTKKKRVVICWFLPGTRFRFIWDVLCTVGIIYYCVFIPYRIAFRPVKDEITSLTLFDYVVDVFFVVDFYLRSTHFAFSEHGMIATETRSIRKHYMGNGIWLDLVSCFSLIDIFSYRWSLVTTFKFRLLCLIRVLRIPSFFNLIADHLSLRDIGISLSSNLLGLIFFFYAVANHWVACMWFIIHRELEADLDTTWATQDCPWGGEEGNAYCTSSWIEALGKHSICNLSMIDCYIRSLHFSITTLSTVGYGDISPVTELETIWENIVVLIGACFLAGLIGAMVQLLSQNDTLGANSFKTKIQKLKEYMVYRKLPPSLQNNILFFHHCRWRDSQTNDEREMLSILPEPLQLDISFAVKSARAIQVVPILRSLPNIVQKRLCNALILQVYPPNSVIYSVGELGWEIYFIASGVVSIVLPSDLSELDSAGRADAEITRQKFQSIGFLLGVGNHVGESCLKIQTGVRQESVITKSKVEVYALSKDDLDTIGTFMEHSKRKMLVQSLLTKNGNCWHTFEDINESEDNDNISLTSEIESMAVSRRKKQNSQNSGSFPWSSSKSMTSIGATGRASTIMTKRRMSAARLRAYTVTAPQHK